MTKHAKHAASKSKAREILHHGEVHGQVLTPRQQRFFGARASGQPVKGKGSGKKGK